MTTYVWLYDQDLPLSRSLSPTHTHWTVSFLCTILQVESIVLKSYGMDAYRMFRHLSKEDMFCPTDKVRNSCWQNRQTLVLLINKRSSMELLECRQFEIPVQLIRCFWIIVSCSSDHLIFEGWTIRVMHLGYVWYKWKVRQSKSTSGLKKDLSTANWVTSLHVIFYFQIKT